MRRPTSPLLVITTYLCINATSSNAAPIDDVALGQLIFNDTRLSEPAGQACSSCYAPQSGFADRGVRISEGTVAGRFGQRNAPARRN